MKTLLRAVTAAAALLLLVTAQSAHAVDTFIVDLHGVYIEPRGIDPPRPADVSLEVPPLLQPKLIDLRYVTGLRYQVQGATCYTPNCNPVITWEPNSDTFVTLHVSFDKGMTWKPIPGAGVALTPRSLTYSPPLMPTVLVTLPAAMRKNNALLRSMVYYLDYGIAVVGAQTVQFYK